MLVFYEGIHVWQSLKNNQRKRWKKTYICHMWARFSDICQCQSVSCHFVCYFLCSSWMVSGCCFNGGPNTRQKRFCAWQRIPINWGSSWGETWWKCWCFLRWVDHLKWIYMYIYIWINWINVTCIIYNYIWMTWLALIVFYFQTSQTKQQTDVSSGMAQPSELEVLRSWHASTQWTHSCMNIWIQVG